MSVPPTLGAYETARRNMVENQLRPNRILDERLLAGFEAVPREAFVPEGMRGVAYADEDIPLGGGRFLVEPLALGKLFQAVAVRADDAALVAGDPTGYAAAVLSRLARAVVLLLPPGVDAGAVERLLGGLECENVEVRTGEPLAGVPERAPFDVVLLTGAVDRIPDALLDQLAEDGRLAVVVEEGARSRVTACRKVGGAVGRTTPFDAALPRLTGMAAPAGFEF